MSNSYNMNNNNHNNIDMNRRVRNNQTNISNEYNNTLNMNHNNIQEAMRNNVKRSNSNVITDSSTSDGSNSSNNSNRQSSHIHTHSHNHVHNSNNNNQKNNIPTFIDPSDNPNYAHFSQPMSIMKSNNKRKLPLPEVKSKSLSHKVNASDNESSDEELLDDDDENDDMLSGNMYSDSIDKLENEESYNSRYYNSELKSDSYDIYMHEGDNLNEMDINEVKAKYKAKNREHAKNTRKRKKGYIETLKQTLFALANEREQIESDRRIALAKLAEKITTRQQVLITMLQFRAQGEQDANKWKTIVDESFLLLLPITPYYSFPPYEVMDYQRHIHGIDALISDTAAFDTMIQSISSFAHIKNNDISQKVKAQFQIDRNQMIVNDNQIMTKCNFSTINAVQLGARYEINLSKIIKAIFSPSNKLLSLEISYDVMSFMQQLRRCCSKHEFQVVPNTVGIAQERSSEARIIIESFAPFLVTYVNKDWCDMYGYERDTIMYKSCLSFLTQDAADSYNIKPSNNDIPINNSLFDVKTRKELTEKFVNVTNTGIPSINIIYVQVESDSSTSSTDCKSLLKSYPLYSTEIGKNSLITNLLLVMETIHCIDPAGISTSYMSTNNSNNSDMNKYIQTYNKKAFSCASTGTYTTSASAVSVVTNEIIPSDGLNYSLEDHANTIFNDEYGQFMDPDMWFDQPNNI
mmetsp:Transcript_17819/g.16089  ORF Transcript_17819/g.16089 Transcript_17819/m.16089 type:complete len:690 (-) Transcript_17819:567-2636(-)